MKKSELKEIIKSEFLTEKKDSKKGNENEQKRMEGAIRDDRDHIKNLKKDIEANEKKLARLKKDYKRDVVKEEMEDELDEMMRGGDDDMDEGMRGSTYEEDDIKAEAEEVDVEDNEDVNIDVEDDIDIDDVSDKSEIEVDSELAGEPADISAILGLLTKAQANASDLGDEKLMDQIGNTITYYTRTHVVAEDARTDAEEEGYKDGMKDEKEDLDEMAAGGLEEKSAGKKLFAEFKKDGLKPNYVADVRKLSDEGEAKDMVHIEPGEGSVEVSSSSNQDKIAQAIKSAGFDVSKKEDNVGDYKLSVFTVDVKNVKEELNEEFKRFQKLAGLIK